ncbi:hypothetical protein BKN38_06890 [Helicobacter sp. CLO-3]|uniref:hypothetical protein n=1 Tax=unclassified Helicobacter TaxID=2593540 RepID=UPI000804DBE4|nr:MULTISPECIES: hypothetical protein [unclassified Helicobacter]OBV28622.1 hypothetical protein BA723_01775 [Helicobacter sp. CLO-3]OHU82497.1 hypothetical protein BKN38_06890 [Helicobacter sp. CLO-3]
MRIYAGKDSSARIYTSENPARENLYRRERGENPRSRIYAQMRQNAFQMRQNFKPPNKDTPCKK